MITMFENKLEELKEEKNLKSKDISKYLNVHESTYSEWEHSKIPIPTKRLIELADFYHINIDYMIGLSKNKITIDKATVIDLKLIGERLKTTRKKLNLSLRNLGNELNFSFSAFASYERGEKLINSEILISFCEATGVSIDWILGRTDY